MKKTLMILAHPNLENSIANKLISDEVGKLENVEVRDIAKLYPDFNVNVAEEQNKLLAHERIIFQYPLYWYNMPPVLKQWFDKVLTYGFAYGGEAKLEGKEFLVSITTGGPSDGYPTDVLEKVLFPLEGTAGFCKMKYLKPQTLYGIMATPDMDTKPLVEKSLDHAGNIIKMLRD
jgi:putative NADPH-quinone reductase